MRRIIPLAILALSTGHLSAAVPDWKIRLDGALVRNGEPYFSLGFYFAEYAFTKDQRLDAMRRIGAGGFNTMLAGIPHRTSTSDTTLVWDVAAYEALLDEAATRGVNFLGPCLGTDDYPTGAKPLEVVARFSGKSNILAWAIADDTDWAGSGTGYFTPAQLGERRTRILSADPTRPTWASFSGYFPQQGSANQRTYLANVDMASLQQYPLFTDAGNLETAYRHQQQASALRASKRQIAVSAQAFRWDGNGNRMPTPAEVRALAYLPLLGGAKSILWYTYADESNQPLPFAHPAVWDELIGIRNDLIGSNGVGTALLDGERRAELAPAGTPIRGASWVIGDAVYLIGVNTSPDYHQYASMPLPKSVSGTPTQVITRTGVLDDPQYPDGLGQNGTASNVMSLLLPPLGVKAYRIPLRQFVTNPGLNRTFRAGPSPVPTSSTTTHASPPPTMVTRPAPSTQAAGRTPPMQSGCGNDAPDCPTDRTRCVPGPAAAAGRARRPCKPEAMPVEIRSASRPSAPPASGNA